MPSIDLTVGEQAAWDHFRAQTAYGTPPSGAPLSALLRAVDEVRPLGTSLEKLKAGVEASVDAAAAAAAAPVQSVAGKTGAVTLVSGDITSFAAAAAAAAPVQSVAGKTGAVMILTADVAELLSVTDLTTYSSVSGTGAVALRTTITAPSLGHVLTWDGSNWVNLAPAPPAVPFPLLAPAGSEAAPSYSFSGDSETGLYSYGAGYLGCAVGGVLTTLVQAGIFSTITGGAFDVRIAAHSLHTWDNGTNLFLFAGRDGGGGYLQLNAASPSVSISAPGAPVADADVLPGHISFYRDEAGNSLKVKVRYADGTVKTGTVAALS